MTAPPSFLASFSKSRLFLSKDFPKIPLAVLWDFNGLQGKKIQSVCFQIFSPRRPRFGRTSSAIAPHSADSRRQGSSALSPVSRASREHGGGGRVHRGA